MQPTKKTYKLIQTPELRERMKESRKTKIKTYKGHIRLNDYYDIEWERINTPMKLVVWVHHLQSKHWMGHGDMRDFIQTVSDHFGWEVPWGC